MNHIYRTVWNELTNTFVAVAENVMGRGKRSGSSCTDKAGAESASSGAPRARRKLVSSRPQMLRLEPRLVFDGAAVDTLVDSGYMVTEVMPEAAHDGVVERPETVAPAIAPVTEKSALETGDLPDLDAPTPQVGRVEIILIDASVTDWKTLTAGLSPEIPVILLPSAGDGVAALAEALAEYSHIDTLHLVSHGGTGYLQLGDTRLDSAALELYSAQLGAIANQLAPGADVMVYGCSVGAGEQGQAFVEDLAAALGGADIAASADRTGPIDLGGDWDLELVAGEIESVLPFTMQGMQGIDQCLSCAFPGNPSLCSSGSGSPPPPSRSPSTTPPSPRRPAPPLSPRP